MFMKLAPCFLIFRRLLSSTSAVGFPAPAIIAASAGDIMSVTAW